MKKWIGILVILGFLGGAFYIYTSQTPVSEIVETEYKVDESDFISAEDLINPEVEVGELTEKEISGILLMREEEKLARDVYTKLGEKWNLGVFSNISKSEQTHMDAMKSLLLFYGMDDPVSDDSAGVFKDKNLASLYTSLIDKGMQSLEDALFVGATIEDLDIYDLDRLMLQTDKENILSVYKNLQKGSRNHLRAFNKQIESNGGAYDPQYISEELFNSIVGSNQEKGTIK